LNPWPRAGGKGEPLACIGDDIFAELDTLKAWMLQSYVAVAPKRLGKLVSGMG